MQEIKKKINEAQAILITAGAGMGVDSGLPDFRGNEGFWKAYPAIKKLGLNFSQMANPLWFETDPKLAWAFYGHRLHLYRDTTPHEGFTMLKNLVEEKSDNYFIVTSNVDGQFQKAGFDTNKIVEVHGSIHHMQCSKNCTGILSADSIDVAVDMENFQATTIPLCPKCSAPLRPNILMFNDWYWDESRANKQEARYRKWLKENKTKKLIIIELGAGEAIPTIRLTSQRVAESSPHAMIIRINPRDYAIDEALGVGIAMGAKAGLEAIL